MPQPSEEDLFRDSTMSFGEHLDELRSALFKAVLAIAAGFLLGLLCANWVVQRVKQPLEEALERYHTEQAIEDFAARIAAREAAGEKIPAELKDPAYIKELVEGDQLLFEEVYLDPVAVAEALRRVRPDLLKDVDDAPEKPAGPPKKSDLVRTLLWHTVQDDTRIRVVALNSQEVFFIWMKAALISGIVLASPAVFYFLWSFVAAGLYPHEKSYVYIFLPFSLALFLAGVSLAFFFVFPPVLNFFFSFNRSMGIAIDPRISEWVSFVLLLPLGFGICFQLPLVMLFIERIGIVSIDTYKSQWRMAVLGMAVAGMVLTPTGDPYTLLMLLGPMIVLYFLGIGLCKWMPKHTRPSR